MRAFVVLCLIALAAAQYDYSARNSGVDEAASTIGALVNSGIGAVGGQEDLSAPIADNEFEKEFYSFSAPEGEFNDGNAAEQIANSLKRNLRVVFIKGPENKELEDAALQLAKSAADQRTAIYVLNKQTDIGELANKLNALGQNSNNKPEVHFVKYRTAADAENAQRTIKAEYDSLPGSSSSSNGGNAPVLDFSSKASAPSAGKSSSSGNAGASNNAYIPPKSSYLPPGRRF